MPRTDVYIGLGSNLENPNLQIRNALRKIKQLPNVQLLDYSSLYQTDPVGYDNQPVFMNAVAKLNTTISSIELLDHLQCIESSHHRVRTSNQNAPRTLDLDILLFGNLICETERLVIPHPRMISRRFVLEPLVEIAPDIAIPGRGYASHFLSKVSDQGCELVERILLS